jgi:hypothetical protein
VEQARSHGSVCEGVIAVLQLRKTEKARDWTSVRGGEKTEAPCGAAAGRGVAARVAETSHIARGSA